MAKPVASRGTDQFVIRFPDGMRQKIKTIADREGRSMNSQIVSMLEKYIFDDDWITNPDEQYTNLLEDMPSSGKEDERDILLRKFVEEVNESNSQIIKMFIKHLYPNSISAKLSDNDTKDD